MDSSKPLKITYATRIATVTEIDDIMSTTNDAFMADSFFKKPEYHQRFTRSDVESLIATPDSAFVCAFSKDVDGDKETMVGSIYLEWSMKGLSGTTDHQKHKVYSI